MVDEKLLAAPMSLVAGPVSAPAGVTGSGPVFLVSHHGADAMLPLRYALEASGSSGELRVEAATAPFHAVARDFARGSWIVTGIDREILADLATRLGLAVVGGTGGIIIAIVGLVPIGAGAGNVCLLGPVLGSDLHGSAK